MAYDFKELKQKISDASEWLGREFRQIRTGQASPAVLDSIRVEAYGAPLSLKEVAGVTIEGGRTLRIEPWDKSHIKEIEKAITAANLGLSVAADSDGLRVNFPELTSDRRREIAKAAKDKLEEARKQIRAARDQTVKDIQAKEKDAGMGKDDAFRHKNEAQKLVDEANKKLEEIYEKKEKEIVG